MKGISIRSKLWMLVVFPLLCMSLLCALSLWVMSMMNQSAHQVNEDEVQQISEIKQISDFYAVNVVDAVNKANVGILTREEALKSVSEAQQKATTAWQHYMGQPMSGPEQKMAVAAQQLLTNANDIIDRVKPEITSQAPLAQVVHQVYGSVDPLTNQLSQLVELQLKYANQHVQALENMSVNFSVLFMVITGATLIFLALLGTWIFRGISQPLAVLRSTLFKLQHDQDLTITVPIIREDELGQVARALNDMVGHFRHLIGQMDDVAEQLSSGADSLNELGLNSAEKMAEQRSETDQNAAAMNEMSATVNEIAQNTSSAAVAARQAEDKAEEGQVVVKETIDNMALLSDQLQGTSKVLQNLAVESNNINQVMGVIRAIAEQTNLLALNAAIEAARAGEQGRGFAVVADEVRVLAQRTQSSTGEIENTVNRLQQNTKLAVESMGKGLSEVEKTNSLMLTCGVSLGEIVRAVDALNGLNAQVAAAAEEQSKVTEEMTRSMVNIADIAVYTSTSAADVSKKCKSLDEMAQSMKAQINQFKWRAKVA
ncbi:methyl-accepting chemotaxis protein [Aeromonas hydrophila]|uniref:methyl-accepting chemotaxis protein n=1 Tax=Aeromonas hydrophila TaxID=644 RepID=UPI002F405FC3